MPPMRTKQLVLCRSLHLRESKAPSPMGECRGRGMCSKALTFENAQIYLAFCSLNRTFAGNNGIDDDGEKETRTA